MSDGRNVDRHEEYRRQAAQHFSGPDVPTPSTPSGPPVGPSKFAAGTTYDGTGPAPAVSSGPPPPVVPSAPPFVPPQPADADSHGTQQHWPAASAMPRHPQQPGGAMPPGPAQQPSVAPHQDQQSWGTTPSRATPQPAPSGGPPLFNLQPFHVLAGVAGIALVALLFSPGFFWLLVLMIAVGGAWFVRVRRLPWPPNVHQMLVRARLAIPGPGVAHGFGPDPTPASPVFGEQSVSSSPYPSSPYPSSPYPSAPYPSAPYPSGPPKNRRLLKLGFIAGILVIGFGGFKLVDSLIDPKFKIGDCVTPKIAYSSGHDLKKVECRSTRDGSPRWVTNQFKSDETVYRIANIVDLHARCPGRVDITFTHEPHDVTYCLVQY